jgi:hypothetical protein
MNNLQTVMPKVTSQELLHVQWQKTQSVKQKLHMMLQNGAWAEN